MNARPIRRRLSLLPRAGLLMAATLLLGAGSAAPVEQDGKSLREAVERNQIVPLKSIMDWIESHYEGQIIEVELENSAGFFGYEVDLLTPRGAKIEFQFNARTGELLSIEGRDIDGARKK